MSWILIVGYGNPLRSDDGLGWRAAEELSRKLSSAENAIEVIVRHQLTPELADNIKTADAVFFIDATSSGRPGELSCKPVLRQPWIPHSHECSPAAVLALARHLFDANPVAFAVSLCGECFDHGETLSLPVIAGLPHLIALVEKLSAEVGARHAPIEREEVPS
ncbi:MAG: hydrogenase maturation protease [Terriglobales bacterium]